MTLPDRLATGIHAVPVAADVKPNHALPECFLQHLAGGDIIANVGDDQCVVVMAPIDLSQ